MSETPYSLTDLIRDDNFITWVRKPNPEQIARWENYLRRFPEQKQTIELAAGYVNLIAEDTGRDLPTLSRSKKMWKKVKETIDSENSNN